MRYYLQVQAPNGGWSDSVGSDVYMDCVSHGEYLRAKDGRQVRVVERRDIPLWHGDDSTRDADMLTVTISRKHYNAATVACSYVKSALFDSELAAKYDAACHAMIVAEVKGSK